MRMEGQSEQQLDATPVIAMCARFTVLKSATGGASRQISGRRYRRKARYQPDT